MRIERRCRVGQWGARLRPGKASRRADGKRQRLDIPLHGQRGGTISRSLLRRRPWLASPTFVVLRQRRVLRSERYGGSQQTPAPLEAPALAQSFELESRNALLGERFHQERHRSGSGKPSPRLPQRNGGIGASEDIRKDGLFRPGSGAQHLELFGERRGALGRLTWERAGSMIFGVFGRGPALD